MLREQAESSHSGIELRVVSIVEHAAKSVPHILAVGAATLVGGVAGQLL